MVTRRGDTILAVFVVIIAAMLLVPLPPTVLDFLLVTNIAVSLLLLLVGLYMPDSLGLLAFPSLLLLTTLFRLGLNVASTRLILLNGEAGEVIKSFGQFLVQGEVLVGVIIFTIITLVNFLVVARGSSRVAEVAARFALDALPGKQLTIDSELRSGALTSDEAKIKREDLRKESQLYGSMDGAMKFVQGDVIAGFFIIITNILGGVYLGVSRGMSISDAIHKYTILTVGDGLVSQIPAILISTCAGIVVTRVSSGEKNTLGKDLGTQLFGRPETLSLTGLMVMFVGLLPGLPKLPFIFVGLTFLIGARWLRVSRLKAEKDFHSGSLQTDAASRTLARSEAPLTLLLDAQILFPLYLLNKGGYITWWRELTTDFYSDVGIKLPELVVLPDTQLAPSQAIIRIQGTEYHRQIFQLDSVLVEIRRSVAQLMKLEVLSDQVHPVDGSKIVWCAKSPFLREITTDDKIRTLDFMQFLFLKTAALCKRYPETIFRLSEVQDEIRGISNKQPALAAEVLERNGLSIARLTELLQECIRQDINIKNLKEILEGVASYYATRPGEEDFFSLDDMVSSLRLQNRRAIVAKQLSSRGTLKIITMDSEIEEIFEKLTPSKFKYLSETNSHPLLLRAKSSIQEVFEPFMAKGVGPITILCRSDLRETVSAFLFNFIGFGAVITPEEIEPSVLIERVGIWQ